MDEVVLEANKREVIRRGVGALRRSGKIPAVVYGSGIESTPVELDAKLLTDVLSRTSASTLISLAIGKQKHQVLVRDIQRDVIRQDILHVDFLKVAMDVVISTEVPVELVGESPAVKELGGLLVTGLSSIEVEALPADLPDRVTVDLGMIVDMDDSIMVSDIEIGEGVEILTSLEELLASVVYQVEEEEEEVVEVEEIIDEELEPEVIERGKPEDEEEEEG
jgi:large subunit ribosomal protein L25